MLISKEASKGMDKNAVNGEEYLAGKDKNSVDKKEYPAGIKWTKQRKRVYQILKDAVEPLSAAQIYARMEEWEQEQYAVSTIYRILSAFEENELVEKTTWMGEGTVVYELKRSDHVHYAVCLECHRRIPLEYCPLHMAGAHIHVGEHFSTEKQRTEKHQQEGILADELETDDFTVVSHKIELYGYCKDCRQKH